MSRLIFRAAPGRSGYAGGMDLSPPLFAAALGIALLAGLIKGLTGFAMPMVLISGLSLFLPPQVALAGLILPTLVTNGMQALRGGWPAARRAIVEFRLYLGVLLVCLVLSAQLVNVLSVRALFLLIGVPITLFALMQLVGWRPRLAGRSAGVEMAVGGFSGLVGGVSGVWGPPTVAYLTAIDVPKADHVRTQGVIYGLGALLLLIAHVRSGVVTAQTVPFSAALLVPAIAGMLIGQRLNDRIDERQFRRAVLVVLFVAGANLVRRGIGG
ncbi:sulfite exporter TauE/SafE family protein [Wenxinia marina]|uniref:Probable membrane transporter protein n=1 Tax=Wenxinia marina DSM 24838 TaxID=1123501 RepID=A0A0D0Q085_9RHOB|nr:sulfite exporter TauE/SafE family protein [Wenxinia marina]KIQ68014.1 putative permease [Wenxinia marina DSM 24838]GGL75389.1 membrane protein [Wenxinia marina]